MKYSILFLSFLSPLIGFTQGNSSDYYYQIPDYPENYTAGTVAGRMVDGLGFRYYWSTEGLNESDLKYRPGDGARSVEETIDHIVTLTQVLLSAVSEKPFEGIDLMGLSFDEKRVLTLDNIKMASERLKTATNEDLERFNMIFASGGEFPFWNLLNGPIADAINHVGQIITLRRTNGNPINQDINVLQGSVKE